jgi:hypothetical protein
MELYTVFMRRDEWDHETTLIGVYSSEKLAVAAMNAHRSESILNKSNFYEVEAITLDETIVS